MRWTVTSLAVLVQLGVTAVHAQQSNRYFPLDHRSPGKAAVWNTTIDPARCGRVQPVEITVPDGGQVGVLNTAAEVASPAQADLEVGRTYRLKVSGLTEYPGVELYPSVEMIDHLHAPAGLEHEYPVPIEITIEDIDAALQNRLVTKVIYLEQSDIAFPEAQEGGPRVTEFSPRANLMQKADERGRPVAIVRLGGRLPDLRNPDPSFLGTGREVKLAPAAGRAQVQQGANQGLLSGQGNSSTSLVSTTAPNPRLRPETGARPFPSQVGE